MMTKPHSWDTGSVQIWDIDLYFMILVILNCIPISAYSGLLKFAMKMFVNVAR